ncbi:MAG: hypothetical protein ACOCYZ_04300 [Halococcoides sp.]
MTDDIDAIADSLGAVKAGPSIGTAAVARVRSRSDAVEVTLETPAGSTVQTELVRPPVWGPNCALKRLCGAYDVDPPDFEALEGEDVPVRRATAEGRPRLEIDIDAL